MGTATLSQRLKKFLWDNHIPASLEYRYLGLIAVTAAGGAFVFIFTNLFMNPDWKLVLVPFAAAIANLWIFKLIRKKQTVHGIIIALFFTNIAILNYNWFVNGGFTGPTLFLMMTVPVALALAADWRLLGALNGFILINTAVLFGIQYYFPNSISPYLSERSQAIDIFVTFAVTQSMLVFMAGFIAKNFQQQKACMERKRQLAIRLAETRTLTDALDAVLKFFLNEGFVDAGGYYEINNESKTITLLAHHGLSAKFIEATRSLPLDSPQGNLVLSGRPHYTLYTKISPSLTQAREEEDLRALAIVPIVFEGHVLGSLNLSSHQHNYFSEDARILIETVTAQIGGIIARIRAQQKQELMQVQLLHASKLASIGTLAAGIAHEINNPLMIIQGATTLIQQNGSDPQSYAMVQRSIKRISAIVQGLRVFARADTDVQKPTPVRPLIEEAIHLLSSMFHSHGIRIQFEATPPDLAPSVMANAGRLQQVLMNILTNAKDALEEKKSDGLIRIQIRETDEEVEVNITDDGPGIPLEIQTKIFDPFFTTKPPGKGTGLGLSICHSIMCSFGGSIDVTSNDGTGTCFLLHFPRLLNNNDSPVTEPPKKATQSKLYHGHALIVDDEPDLRELIRILLERLGFKVDEAENGEQGLERLKQVAYDLVLTDIQMPRLNGEKMIEQARGFLNMKNTTFVIITGNLPENMSSEELQRLRLLTNSILLKPFSFDSVSKAVAQAMKSKQ